MANPERVIEKLYEDAAVRDSLADAEADTLLRWGEDQIMRLADVAPDDDTFEALTGELRGLLKDVNRFVGERGQLDAETRKTRLEALMAEGEALGAPPSAEAASVAESFAVGDDATTLQALLGLLTPVEGAASTAAPVAPAADAKPDALPTVQPEPETAPPPVTTPAASPAPERRSVLDAFRNWITPANTEAPPPDDTPGRPQPPAPPPSDDDITGDAFLHGETQDDWLE